jgi:hypothetical protein
VSAIAADIQVDRAALGEQSASFEGDPVRPGDATYDGHHRVWNGSIDRFPALIARCRGVADVMTAVKFARSSGLPVAVRAGGHSYPGYSVCDGGIVIDLGPMKGIRVDPETRGRASRQASSGASSTARPSRSGSPPPAASSATPVSPA